MSGRRAFASTRTEWLELPNGGRVEAKVRLNVEEQKALESAPLVTIKRPTEGPDNPEGQVQDVGVDWSRHYLRKLHLYLVDWEGLDDEDGKPVPFSHAAVDGLDPDVADEVTLALNAFLDAEEAKRKSPPSATPEASSSGPTSSPSPGATSP